MNRFGFQFPAPGLWSFVRMRLNWSKRIRVLWLLGLLFTQGGLLYSRAQTTRVWDAGGATGSWTDAANWDTSVPASSGESAQFGGGADNPVTQNHAANLTIGQIEFTAAAITRTIAASPGNKFTIDASSFSGIGVVNNSGNNMTLSAPIDLGSSQTWRTASTGQLTFSGAVALGGHALTLDAGSDLITISGVISGSGADALIKTGASTVSLGGTAANTFTGVTTVNEGRVELNKTANIIALGGNLVIGDGSGAASSAEVRFLRDGQMSSTATVTINSDGLLALNGQDQTLGAISLDGSGITTGSGILTMNGGLTINASATSASLTGRLNLGGAARVFDVPDGGAAVDLSVAAVISGTGVGLTKNGAGFLSLAGNNTFDGGLTINAGTVEFGNNGGNGTGVLTINGGVIQASATRTLNEGVSIGGNFTVAGANAFTLSGAMDLNGATRVITVDNSALTTFSGVISNGGLTKEGAGILSLAGANTFTGNVTINTGTLRLGANDALADSVNVVVNGATFDLSSRNDTIGQLEMTAGTVMGSGTLTLGANPLFHASAAGATISGRLNLGAASRTFDVPDGTAGVDLSISGAIAGTGVGFIKDGAGFLYLGGNNTYSGGLTLNAGTVELGNNNAAGSGTLTLNGGTIQASAARFISEAVSVGGNFTVGGTNDLTLSGAMNLGGGTRVVTVANTGGTFFSGVISNGGLTKDGPGTLRLSGGSPNTYTGTTTVNDGLLMLGKSGNVSAFAGGLVIGDGTGGANSAEVRLMNNGQIPDSSSVSILADGLLALNDRSDTVGSISMTGGAITTGTGTLTMNGDMTVVGSAGGSTVSGNLNLGGTTRIFAVADGAAATDLSISAIISNGGVTKDGAGLLSLSGNNSFASGLNINAGTVEFGHNSAAGSGTITIAGGTTIQASGTRALANAVAINGDFTVAGSSALSLGTGGINLGGATRTVTVNNSADTTFTGVISNGGLTKEGSGTLVLHSTTTSTFTGGLTINAGTLKLGNSDQIADTAQVVVASGATFDLNGKNDTIGALTMSGGTVQSGVGTLTLGGTVTFNGAAGTATITGNLSLGSSSPRTFNVADGAAATDLDVTALVSGSVQLAKTGAGTLRLSNSGNSYNGGTDLSAGTILMADKNALGTTGTLTMAGGTTLELSYSDAGGNATLSGITMNGNSTISRTATGGNKSGLLDSGTLTVNGTATLIDQGGDAGANSALVIDGNLSIANGAQLTLNASGASDEVRLGGTGKNITISAGGTLVTTGAGTKTIGSGSGRTIIGQGTGSGANQGAFSESKFRVGSGTVYDSGTAIQINGSGQAGLMVTGAPADVSNLLNTRVSGLTGSGGTLTVVHTGSVTNTFGLQPSAGSPLMLGFSRDSATDTPGYTVNAAVPNWAGLVIKGGTTRMSVNQNFTGNSGSSSFYIYDDIYGATPAERKANSVLTFLGNRTITFNGDGYFYGGTINANTGGGAQGTLVFSGDLYSYGTVLVGGPNITMDVLVANRSISGSTPLTGMGNFTKTGPGTLTLNVPISVSPGGAGIQILQGTLALGADNMINDAGSNMQLSTGVTFASQGYDATLGTLSLSGTGTIDLGGGSSVLHFQDSDSITWGSGTSLTINNWTGSGGGGGTDQLYFGTDATGLTTGQLDKIVFVNPAGFAAGIYSAQILPSGEVVPLALVPEPATVATVGLLGLALVWREWRRRRIPGPPPG